MEGKSSVEVLRACLVYALGALRGLSLGKTASPLLLPRQYRAPHFIHKYSLFVLVFIIEMSSINVHPICTIQKIIF